jgi:hypothetical protein
MKLKLIAHSQHEICELLEHFCHHHHRRVITRRATYSYKSDNGSIKGISFTAEGDHMALVVKDTDVPGTVTATVTFADAKGKPAKVDGVPTWVASDPTIVDTVTPAADGLSAVLHVTDTVGVSQITVSADVDLGSGVNSVDFVDTVSVIAGDAVSATFSFGAVTHD